MIPEAVASEADNPQACFAGALFGVDAGIIGGVLAMPDFKRYATIMHMPAYTPVQSLQTGLPS